MTRERCLEWFHYASKASAQKAETAYDYLYKYMLRYFGHHANHILREVRRSETTKDSPEGQKYMQTVSNNRYKLDPNDRQIELH
jgi:hypothetical protein